MNAQRHRWNRRKAMAVLLAVSVILLAAIAIAGQVLKEQALATDFTRKNLPPSLAYPFGTDWMGRDMFIRSLTGLSISIRIGLLTACISAVAAFIMGTMAACLGRVTDAVIGGIIDLVMGIPHILLLILISFAVGKGFWGVLIGISLTHWTSLARLLRGEVMQLRESQYIQVAKKLGKGRLYIALKHMTPHLLPQLFVGMVLLFPHAIPGHGKMVAGPVSGAVAGICGGPVPFYRGYAEPSAGPGPGPSVESLPALLQGFVL